jgi:hypothetical protein
MTVLGPVESRQIRIWKKICMEELSGTKPCLDLGPVESRQLRILQKHLWKNFQGPSHVWFWIQWNLDRSRLYKNIEELLGINPLVVVDYSNGTDDINT